MSDTERIARLAIDLHRLALAAAEAQDTPSSVAKAARNHAGAADPTPAVVMDDRRVALQVAATEAVAKAKEAIGPLVDASKQLSRALDAWQTGK